MVRIGNVELGDFPLLLAPMEDVSDPPFRSLCKEQSCDMMYTEFVSVQGLIRDVDKSLKKIELFEEERPVGIQIFGGDLEAMVKAVEVVEKFKPEVLDINFGCPVKKVIAKGSGAALLQDIPKMVEMTRAVVNATNIPVTVKTRKTKKDKAHVTTMSYSSLMEVLNQVIISKELNFINDIDYKKIRESIEKIANKLNALRKSQINI